MTAAANQTASATVSRNAIKLVFLVHALATGSMFTRIPDFQLALEVDEGVLGATLLGQPIGAIATFLFTSRLVEGLGTRLIILYGLPLLALSVALMAAAPSPAVLFVVFLLFGGTFAATNVAINVEADRVEAATGRRLMNTCHGIWSIGQLIAVSLGAVARGVGVSPLLHLGPIVPLVLLAAILVVLPMRGAPAREHSGSVRRRVVVLPTLMTLLLVGYAIAGALLEGATRMWSVIYMRDSFSAPSWVDTLTLPAFIGATAFSRFFADGLIARFGPARVARSLAAVSLLGLAAVVTAQNLVWALAGFTLIGIGVCVSFPLSTSAAARLGDRPASENVAALTLSTQMILLGAPALFGVIATTFGIRMSYAMLAPVVLVALYLARYLAPREER